MTFQKGHKINTGIKQTEEHIKKIVKTRKDKKSYKINSGCFKKGHKQIITEEMKKKIGKSNRGRKRSVEIKEKLSKSHMGRKRKKWEKEKISNTWNKPEYKKIAKERRVKQIFPKNDSLIEIKIQNFLKELKIGFIPHQYISINHAYQVDIYIPSKNLIIECDGDYWHNYPYGRNIDIIRTKELREKGFKVIRLWGCDIKKMTLKEFGGILI